MFGTIPLRLGKSRLVDFLCAERTRVLGDILRDVERPESLLLADMTRASRARTARIVGSEYQDRAVCFGGESPQQPASDT